jgi:hypothetical protein
VLGHGRSREPRRPGARSARLWFALVGVATSLLAFVAGVIVVGFGKGLFASPSRALLYDLFERRRGRALFLPVAGVLGAVALVYVVWNRGPYAFERPSLDTATTARRLAGTADRRLVLGAYALFFGSSRAL